MAGAPLAGFPLLAKMTHFRWEEKGCAVTRRLLVKMARTGTRDVGGCGASGTACGRQVFHRPHRARQARWPPRDTCPQRGWRGLREWDRPEEPSEWPARRTERGRGGRPTLSRRTPRWAWVCAATATDPDGTARLYRRRRRDYTRPPSQSARASVRVCERDLPMEVYQENVPAHIPQKGVSKPRSGLEAVRWEQIPVIPLFGVCHARVVLSCHRPWESEYVDT